MTSCYSKTSQWLILGHILNTTNCEFTIFEFVNCTAVVYKLQFNGKENHRFMRYYALEHNLKRMIATIQSLFFEDSHLQCFAELTYLVLIYCGYKHGSSFNCNLQQIPWLDSAIFGDKNTILTKQFYSSTPCVMLFLNTQKFFLR